MKHEPLNSAHYEIGQHLNLNTLLKIIRTRIVFFFVMDMELSLKTLKECVVTAHVFGIIYSDVFRNEIRT